MQKECFEQWHILNGCESRLISCLKTLNYNLYSMISKICTGHSFYGSIRYICQEKKHAQVLEVDGVRDHDHKLMIQDFERQHSLRPEKKQACFHGILSFYPGEKPSDALITEIAEKYLTELNIQNTQY